MATKFWQDCVQVLTLMTRINLLTELIYPGLESESSRSQSLQLTVILGTQSRAMLKLSRTSGERDLKLILKLEGSC